MTVQYTLHTPLTKQDLAPLRAGDTVLLSGVDTGTLNRLGMYLTCDPVYEEEDRKYHKQ